MNSKETNIEKIVREQTPFFVVGTSYYVEKYQSMKPLYDVVNIHRDFCFLKERCEKENYR